MQKTERCPPYCVTVRLPLCVLTPPTETTTGCTPTGTVAGTTKFNCVTPTRPGGIPTKATVAASPSQPSAAVNRPGARPPPQTGNWRLARCCSRPKPPGRNVLDGGADAVDRSEEHTSELQSLRHLVC